MSEPGWLSILPPLLAIVLAIRTRQVILSLVAGIWIGHTVAQGLNPLAGAAAGLDGIVGVFTEAGDARVLIFTLLVGSLIATIEHSGGVRGFVSFLETRRWVHTGRRAQLLAWGTGLVIFIESNITLLVAGAVSRPLFDRYRVSREKLAYLIDATSAPVCVMIPLNAWGAVIIGLVGSAGIDNPLQVFIASIPYNLYAIVAILLALLVIWKGLDLGAMRAAEARTQSGQLLWPGAIALIDVSAEKSDDGAGHGPDAGAPESGSVGAAAGGVDVPGAATASPLHMLLPIVAMIATMPVGLYVTGAGNLIEGSGSTAILWSVSVAILVSWTMMLSRGQSTVSDLMRVFMEGAGRLLPIATILLLALALGDVAGLLGTGPYVAGIAGAALPPVLLAPLVFLVSGFIAFSVGSSWGTFAIMIPIAIPIATGLDLPVPLLLGAAISGAIFGDHASPISDTTVVASMAAATDHIDHVRTQLPYALLAGAIATAGFFVLSLLA